MLLIVGITYVSVATSKRPLMPRTLDLDAADCAMWHHCAAVGGMAGTRRETECSTVSIRLYRR